MFDGEKKVDKHGKPLRGFWEYHAMATALTVNRIPVHSFNFIFDHQLNWKIRAFWTAIFVTCISIHFSITFHFAWRYWVAPHIILNFGETQLHNFPFPALTFCSPLFNRNPQISMQAFRESQLNTDNMTLDDQQQFLAGAMWCEPDDMLKAYNQSEFELEQGVNLLKIMNQTQSQLDDFIFACNYRTLDIDCNKLFKRVLTEEGFCFAYNQQDFHTIFRKRVSDDFKDYGKYEKPMKVEWTFDGGFTTRSDLSYPRRATKIEELVMHIKVPNDVLNNTCSEYAERIYVYLHPPSELINKKSSRTHRVDFTSDHHMALSAKAWRTKPEQTRKYPAKLRQCYFENERPLKYFKLYSDTMCKMECLSNHTFSTCNCVNFAHPRDNDMPICQNATEVKCMQDANTYYIYHNHVQQECDCMPSCIYVKYLVDFTKDSPLAELVTDEPIDYPKNYTVTRMKFFIFNNDIYEHQQVCTYTATNLLSDFGGLTGLFSGASFIAGMEIFLLTTMHYRKRQKRRAQLKMMGEYRKRTAFDGFFHQNIMDQHQVEHQPPPPELEDKPRRKTALRRSALRVRSKSRVTPVEAKTPNTTSSESEAPANKNRIRMDPNLGLNDPIYTISIFPRK